MTTPAEVVGFVCTSIPAGTTAITAGEIMELPTTKGTHTAVVTTTSGTLATGAGNISVSQDGANWITTALVLTPGSVTTVSVSGAFKFVAANITTALTTTESPETITGVSAASPAVVTATAHGYTSGDVVTIAAVTGTMSTVINVAGLVVTVLTANTFSVPVNTTGLTYVSGGTATKTAGAGMSSVTVTVASA